MLERASTVSRHSWQISGPIVMDMYDTHARSQSHTYVHTHSCMQADRHARTHAHINGAHVYSEIVRTTRLPCEQNDRVMLISRVALARILSRTRINNKRNRESEVRGTTSIRRTNWYGRHYSYMARTRPVSFSERKFPTITEENQGNDATTGITIVLTCDVCPATSRGASMLFASGPKPMTKGR